MTLRAQLYFLSDTMSVWPEVGRWIKYTDRQGELKCKVYRYEDGGSVGWTLGVGAYQETERQAVVEYDVGDEDMLSEPFLKMINWSYTGAPGEEELEIAVTKRNNEIRGISCQTCKSTSSKLLKCKACKKVYYCDIDCQRKDWPTHQTTCVRGKVVLQPNPRYPLAEVQQQLAISQKKIQEDFNAALVDAFNGNFKIKINGEWVRKPKATDLKASYRYELRHDSAGDKVVHFKQRALESLEHTNGEPSSCSFFMTMELCMEQNGFKVGGLHYLVGYEMDPNFFWGMVLNFNTFGTVAPFHTNCSCKFPKMPPNYKEMKKKWDKMFSRAKAFPTDVQCMFADTCIGCHSFRLDGKAGCRFKHDIAVNQAN